MHARLLNWRTSIQVQRSWRFVIWSYIDRINWRSFLVENIVNHTINRVLIFQPFCTWSKIQQTIGVEIICASIPTETSRKRKEGKEVVVPRHAQPRVAPWRNNHLHVLHIKLLHKFCLLEYLFYKFDFSKNSLYLVLQTMYLHNYLWQSPIYIEIMNKKRIYCTLSGLEIIGASPAQAIL